MRMMPFHEATATTAFSRASNARRSKEHLFAMAAGTVLSLWVAVASAVTLVIDFSQDEISIQWIGVSAVASWLVGYGLALLTIRMRNSGHEI